MKHYLSAILKRESVPFYPVLIVTYFFLHLYAHNIDTGLQPSRFLNPYFLALAVTLIVWKLLSRAFKSNAKGAFFAFFLTFLFFSYGHFRNLLLAYVIGTPIPQKVYIVFFLLGTLVLPGTLMIKSSFDYRKLTSYFNIATGLLILFPLSTIASHAWHPSKAEILPPYYDPLPVFTKVPEGQPPDIYYIILDEYAREDVLREELQFDNSPFLDALKKRGFFISGHSHSNYLETSYSLSSSLNMRYVDINEDFMKLIKDNQVSRALKKNLAYRYIFVNSGCLLSDSSPTADELISTVGNNDVELMLANTTIINAFTAFFFSESWRHRHRYNFARVGELSQNQAPKFVLAHMLLPHPPFVFDKDGNAPKKYATIRLTPLPFAVGRYHESYPEQLAHTNTMVLRLVDKILENSKNPPVIILQSDHGMDPVVDTLPENEYIHKRSSNLFAVFLPDKKADDFFSDFTTPVNLFRTLFNVYFGADLPVLEDQIIRPVDSGNETEGFVLKPINIHPHEESTDTFRK